MKLALTVLGSAAALAIAVARGGVEDRSAATVTGCLRQGSAETVRLLRSATTGDGPPRDYLLVSVAAGVDLGPLMNHQVAVDGDVFGPGQGPEPPAEANTVEKALRRVTARGARLVADACPAG